MQCFTLSYHPSFLESSSEKQGIIDYCGCGTELFWLSLEVGNTGANKAG